MRPGETMRLSAESEAECNAWVNSLKAAVRAVKLANHIKPYTMSLLLGRASQVRRASCLTRIKLSHHIHP